MAASWANDVRNIPKQEIREILAPIRRPVEVAVFGSKNSFNLSAIIRSGHSFLVSRYWGIEIKTLYEKAMMSARRFDEHLINLVSIDEFLEQTKDKQIVAFEKREGLNSTDIRDFVYPKECVLLFGSEDSGIPKPLIERANHIVHIPMLGLMHDLNIACAATVALFDQFSKEK